MLLVGTRGYLAKAPEIDGSQGKSLPASSLSDVPSSVQASSDSLIACPRGVPFSEKSGIHWRPAVGAKPSAVASLYFS